MIVAVVCLACGEELPTPEERARRICDACQYDVREDDHDVHVPNIGKGWE